MQHEITLRLIDEIARAGSIRSAAEKMAITPSALNRRLLSIEEELDVQLFERLTTGVRLNAAGELFVAHARRQLADMDRVRSQIADLKGARRGHVQIAYDRSLRQDGVLSLDLADYQTEHPGVSFGVDVTDGRQIANRLKTFQADLGYVLHPKTNTDVTSLAIAHAQIMLVSHRDHPLAGQQAARFEDALSHPIVMPSEGALRVLLEQALRRHSMHVAPVVEAGRDFAVPLLQRGDAVCFEVDTGFDREELDGMARTPLSTRDVPAVYVHLVQLRGRALTVAAGRFAERIKQKFAEA